MKRLLRKFDDWWSCLAPKGMEPARVGMIFGRRWFSIQLAAMTFLLNFLAPIVLSFLVRLHSAAKSMVNDRQIGYLDALMQSLSPALWVPYWPVVLFSLLWASLVTVYVYFHTERRRIATLRRLNCCTSCGYPLITPNQPVCTECGNEVERPEHTQHQETN